MGKLDEIKAEIDWLGRWLNVCLITVFALIGWLALNYELQKQVLIYVTVAVISILVVIVALINKAAIKKIREIKDL